MIKITIEDTEGISASIGGMPTDSTWMDVTEKFFGLLNAYGFVVCFPVDKAVEALYDMHHEAIRSEN